MTTLADRAAGCLSGAAVGDALGGPTEGWTTDQIQQRYGGFVEDIVPPYFADSRADYNPVYSWAGRPAEFAVPQGRRPRHGRHVDDAGLRPRLSA